MRFLFIAFFALAVASCKNVNNKEAASPLENNGVANAHNFTTMSWTDTVKNIGSLHFGETTQIKFHFKNTGSKPLTIISAVPACGCTVADYPKEPIEPGAEGDIIAAFDSNKGHEGTFKKSITVTTNTLPNVSTILVFEGEILGKDGGDVKPVAVPKSNG